MAVPEATSRLVQRILLVVLAITIAPVAIWASFAPRSFYADFPGGGRAWVAVDGPYNEHLVRDVGALDLALLVLAVYALVSLARPLVRATALAYLVSGALHLAYHLRHLDLYDTGDQIANAVGLAVTPVVALVLLGATMRPSTAPSSTSTMSGSEAPTAIS
jgi:hypothetical protein